MYRSIIRTYMLVFLIGAISIILAKDDVEEISAEQAKYFLLQRMAPNFRNGTLIDAEGFAYFTALDTLIRAHIYFRFLFNENRLWQSDKCELFGLSTVTADAPVQLSESTYTSLSISHLDELSHLCVYPFFMAAKSFRGYLISPYKTRSEISGVRCIKVAVRVNKDDNDEKSPFQGNLFISDDDEHRLIRVEYNDARSSVDKTIRWEFKNMGTFDFPYKLTISLDTELCSFNMHSMVKIYFANLQQLHPIDTLDTLPQLNITTPVKRN